MGSEVLIYGYGIVCLCMLAYNLCYSVHLRLGDRRQERRVRWMGGLVEAQLARIREGQPVLKWHLPAHAEPADPAEQPAGHAAVFAG